MESSTRHCCNARFLANVFSLDAAARRETMRACAPKRRHYAVKTRKVNVCGRCGPGVGHTMPIAVLRLSLH